MTFGTYLRKLRKKAGLTQRALAELIHMDPSMIHRYEKDQNGTVPKPKTLNSIIYVLKQNGIAQEDVEKLYDLNGYNQSGTQNTDFFDIVKYSQNTLEKLGPKDLKLVSSDLYTLLELEQAFITAQKISKAKKWPRAIENFTDLRSDIEKQFQFWNLRLDMNIAHCHYSNMSFSQAIHFYELARLKARSLGQRSMEGEILLNLGDVNRRYGGAKCTQARQYYTKAKKIFKDAKNLARVADTVRKEACSYIFQGRPDIALHLCQESLQLAHDVGHNKGTYKALQHLAWANRMLGKWQEATLLCQDAINQIPRDDQWNKIKGLRYLGDAYRLAREYEKAEETYRKALDLFEEIGITQSRTYGLIRLGLGKLYLKNDAQLLKAQAHIIEGIAKHGISGNDFREIDFFVEEGDLYLTTAAFSKAENRLELAALRYEEMGNQFHYFRTLAKLCELYFEMGEKYFPKIAQIERLIVRVVQDQAKEEYEKGLLDYFLGKVYFILGKSNLCQMKPKEVVRNWNQALVIKLQFNPECFFETLSQIIEELNSFAQYRQIPEAFKIITGIKGFLEDIMRDASWELHQILTIQAGHKSIQAFENSLHDRELK